ncbi:MAG TPA: cell filamentation protein Fic [Nitrospiraceae bacterium]|nr:MAG: cell filamentation protein Fic [Nitrospirae bacterium GWA2_46_11]OGW25151.1 MAG: cell filamentation protein Fic [Nitrospirae bacterium GWB2_47_37]HAK89569.1 cell filamentation protein Fic [Nitrospiraceae bacterium]HCZ12057.1 cell filamentation protein Fic [Nitrospiraceae bacterium]
MRYLDPKIIANLDEKLSLLNSYRPLPQASVRKLREQFGIEMTYNSNAIEGNSLTLKETFLVIKEGLTIKGKPLSDHIEAKNHTEALEYLYELIDKDSRSTISERLIRELNHIVMRDIDKEWAGRYRNSNVIIGGADHTPPEALDVPLLMQELIDLVRRKKKVLHPVELAAVLHHRLVNIHPFLDGNGRTSRLAMNIILMQSGFPLAVILKNDRKKYYRTLAEADRGNYPPFVRFIAQAVQRSLNIYLKVLTPARKNKEHFIPLSELAKDSKFTGKYLNLLARNGKLEAHKERRNWLSSKEALKRYLDGRERKRK